MEQAVAACGATSALPCAHEYVLTIPHMGACDEAEHRLTQLCYLYVVVLVLPIPCQVYVKPTGLILA